MVPAGTRSPARTTLDVRGAVLKIALSSIVAQININNNIIKGKLNKLFISELCIKLVALSVNRHPRISSQFYKGW